MKLNNTYYKQLLEKLAKYKQEEQKPTFRGFLLYCNITSEELNILKEEVEINNKVAKKIFKLLETYKTELEVAMEKMLIYDKNINHNSIIFLLRASNPKHYSGVVQGQLNKPPEKQLQKILDNKSEIRWSK